MSKEKLHIEDIQTICDLKKSGLMDKDIAEYLGVRPETFSIWVNHPKSDAQKQLAKAYKKAEVERKAAILQRIQKAAVDGSWQAGAWFLERKYPEEFAKPEVQFAHSLAKQAEEETLRKFDEVLVTIRETAFGNKPDA